MESYAIVLAVNGLLPLCRDGLGMLREIFDAPGTLKLSVGRLELQRDKYDLWREVWRNDEGEMDVGFDAYAKSNAVAGKRMLRQLSVFAQVLFDVHALEDKYGLKPTHWPKQETKDLSRFKLKEGEILTPEQQVLLLDRCKANFSFIKRCKFTLRGRDAPWNVLIDVVGEQISQLTTYGPPAALATMAKAELDVLRKMQVDALQRRADTATYEAQNPHTALSDVEKYKVLALAAQFGVVVRFERDHTAVKFAMVDFRLDAAYIISSSRSSTMALLFDYPVRKENRVVLIEWMDDLPNLDRDTKSTTLILATKKPDELLLPKCYGMVEDPKKRRLGLVLAPPAHIRANLPPIMPAGAISQKRMPVSLRELIEKRHPACQGMLELGVRFELAKKLVRAVHMMHNVGWAHKNIRSSCILFFPSANLPTRGSGPPGPASGTPQPIGYGEPLFVGLGSPRVDQLPIPVTISGHAPGPRSHHIPPSASSNSNSDLYYSSEEDEEDDFEEVEEVIEESVFIDEYGRQVRIRAPPVPTVMPHRSRRGHTPRRREREREREREHAMVPHDEVVAHGHGHELVSIDYYAHPSLMPAHGRRDRPIPGVRHGGGARHSYSRAHDIYSLGCVLLELGLWDCLERLVEVEDGDAERVRRGFLSLTMKLDGMAGSIYSNVVRRCLNINADESRKAEGDLERFMAEIEASLEKCCA